MPTIQYSNVIHRGKHWILAKFEFDTALNRQIGKVAGAKWSKTLKGWLLPDTAARRIKYGIGGTNVGKPEDATPQPDSYKAKTEMNKPVAKAAWA